MTHVDVLADASVRNLVMPKKAVVYAAGGIAEYWIVLAEEKSLERYRSPLPNRYRTHETYTASQTIETLCGRLLIQDLFL